MSHIASQAKHLLCVLIPVDSVVLPGLNQSVLLHLGGYRGVAMITPTQSNPVQKIDCGIFRFMLSSIMVVLSI